MDLSLMFAGFGLFIAAAAAAMIFLFVWPSTSTEQQHRPWKQFSQQQQQHNNTSTKQAFSTDAFAEKTAKKERLLQNARQRYLQIHPEFIPPAKLSKAL